MSKVRGKSEFKNEIKNQKNFDFSHEIDSIQNLLKECRICPRDCNINRHNTYGFCRVSSNLVIYKASIEFSLEKSIIGKKGTGAIQFASCNLKCVFCYQYEVSHTKPEKDKEISVEELSKLILDLQKLKPHNISFISPDHYVPQIWKAIHIAKNNGLCLPIVYDSNGYTYAEMLKKLEGLVDIYVPDFKFWDSNFARKYLKAEDYPQVARNSILEMYRQVGDVKFDSEGVIKKGLVVRHLIMPEGVEDSKKILEFLISLSRKIYISIRGNYIPSGRVQERPDIYEEINRRIRYEEFQEVVNYTKFLGFSYIEAKYD